MKLPTSAYIEDGLVVYGDEAFTPSEWARHEKLRLRPYRAEYMRLYRAANAERIKATNKASMWRSRRHPVGSLHDLACWGPTRATGCRCRRIVCYDKPEKVAA